jgi:hypothetical protein
MTTWTNDELNEIGTADELEIAPLRRDGTLRTPVTIWVVRHGDDFYVRSYRGRGGSRFRAAQVRHEGRIWAGGVEKDFAFAEETTPVSTTFVNPMVSAEARSTSIKLVPRSRPA